MTQIVQAAQEKMRATVEHLQVELRALRTNRANPSMLDGVMVEAYGTPTPLRSVANVTAPEARQLLITPFDPKLAGAIGKAIEKHPSISFNPVVDAHSVRLPIPPMDEALRKEIVKTARKKGEEAKVSIRDVRHKGKDQIKKAKASSEITEDQVRKLEKELQELTDRYCAEVDSAVVDREKEILTV